MAPSSKHMPESTLSGKNHRGPRAQVLFSDSEKDANMLYATGVFVPDPFLFVRFRGRKCIVIGDMEYSRVKSEANVDFVCSHREILSKPSAKQGKGKSGIEDICLTAFREMKIRRIEVPKSFPVGLADEFRKKGIVVFVKPDPFFPERSIKNENELKKIRLSLRAAEYGLKVAVETLRTSRVNKRKRRELLLGPERLTAERMRGLIQKAVLDKHCHAMHTIIACGCQGYDPHRKGEGPLRANEPIIVDIFPRSENTGYYGDMTRTFVKGIASEKVRAMHYAVKKAQDLAFSQVVSGAQANRIHKGVVKVFEKMGFPTREENGKMVGFIHGTGHGLGLDIHEHPLISVRSCRLRQGNVVTVEPGLYYPDVGGVRLEDVVVIQSRGMKKLSRFQRYLEID